MYITRGENYDLWGFNNLKAQIEACIETGKEVVHLGSKDGLTLYYIPNGAWCRYFFLERDRDNEIVGALTVNTKRDKAIGYGVGAVYLKRSYRKRGLGTVLYLGAAHVLKKIHSSTCIGEMAVRTWRSLGKYHKLDVYSHPYIKPRKVEYQWDNKYPVVNGEFIDKQPGSFIFTITNKRRQSA